RAQEDRRPLLPRPARPVFPGVRGRVDRLPDLVARRVMHVGEDVLLVVRHHCLARPAGADVLAADDARDLDPLAPHLLDARLQARPLRRPRRVRADRLVERRGRLEDAVRSHGPIIVRRYFAAMRRLSGLVVVFVAVALARSRGGSGAAPGTPRMLFDDFAYAGRVQLAAHGW